MKRVGNLWPGLISFANLVRALRQAARGKRSRPDVAAFLFDQERQLTRLACELASGSYRPGPYRTFQILEPKPRLISAAPFRDRVVHHALCNILEPVFEKRFIADSFACRKNKGTHAAVNRFTHYARRSAFVFKGDIQKYFPSIDHEILKDAMARKIKDERVLDLASQIIDHSNPQEATHTLFTGDDLWSLTERRRGLPLGNQTSQFFANVFLDPFDHFVKETLRAPGYVRYVDDFVLFHDDKKWLAEARERCREKLAGLRLKLHPDKAVISRTADGTRFLGYRVFPAYRLLPKENLKRLRKRTREMQTQYARRGITWDEIRRRFSGWLGHAAQADAFRLTRRILVDTVFRCGEILSTG
jgi:retron-type reverse transcriptase